MSDLEEQFEQSAEAALKLTDRPDNDTLLQMYALYKQASSGDVTGDKPGFFDFAGLAKYEAWEGFRGLAREEAMQQYVDLIKFLGQGSD